MQGIEQRITPHLWFDDRAEEAVRFYTSIFPRSSVREIARYTQDGARMSGRAEGSVMTIEFTLDGQSFTALNGGPEFKFNESISFVIHCEDQAEVDHYWQRLNEGGDPTAQQCGWLKDKFGVSWQVVPTLVGQLMTDRDPERRRRAMAAILGMKKIDVAALRSAAG